MLRQQFTLPSRTTILNHFCVLPSDAGVNPLIIKYLKQVGETMTLLDKICFVTWDELFLSYNLEYDRINDMVIGFEDWGFRRTGEFANHAIVFMIRGIRAGWKIPVFMGFCKDLTNVPDLQHCLKNVVNAVSEAGFTIVASVCDQLSTNAKVVKDLIKQSNIHRAKQGEEEGIFELAYFTFF